MKWGGGGGNTQNGNTRGRETTGIYREFPARKWRFLGIPILGFTRAILGFREELLLSQGGASLLHC